MRSIYTSTGINNPSQTSLYAAFNILMSKNGGQCLERAAVKRLGLRQFAAATLAHTRPCLNLTQTPTSILPRLPECVVPDARNVAYDINTGSGRLAGSGPETAAFVAHVSVKPAARLACRLIHHGKPGVIRFTPMRPPLAFGANGGRKSGTGRVPIWTFMHRSSAQAAARASAPAPRRASRPMTNITPRTEEFLCKAAR